MSRDGRLCPLTGRRGRSFRGAEPDSCGPGQDAVADGERRGAASVQGARCSRSLRGVLSVTSRCTFGHAAGRARLALRAASLVRDELRPLRARDVGVYRGSTGGLQG
eukprot:680172-Prorocentrum_minimum.AAC.1